MCTSISSAKFSWTTLNVDALEEGLEALEGVLRHALGVELQVPLGEQPPLRGLLQVADAGLDGNSLE